MRYKYQEEDPNIIMLLCFKVVSRSSYNIEAPGFERENPFILLGIKDSTDEKKLEKVKMKAVALQRIWNMGTLILFPVEDYSS